MTSKERQITLIANELFSLIGLAIGALSCFEYIEVNETQKVKVATIVEELRNRSDKATHLFFITMWPEEKLNEPNDNQR